uniref:Uncharacterized protein n=1 Tax=Arundo donax TaxID=35708 RepID=A0A0A9DN36_ARUDO
MQGKLPIMSRKYRTNIAIDLVIQGGIIGFRIFQWCREGAERASIF